MASNLDVIGTNRLGPIDEEGSSWSSKKFGLGEWATFCQCDCTASSICFFHWNKLNTKSWPTVI